MNLGKGRFRQYKEKFNKAGVVVGSRHHLFELRQVLVSLKDSMTIQSAEGLAFEKETSEQDRKVRGASVLIRQLIEQGDRGIDLIKGLHDSLPHNIKFRAAVVIIKAVGGKDIKVKITDSNSLSVERLTKADIALEAEKEASDILDKLSPRDRFFRLRAKFVTDLRGLAASMIGKSISMILSGDNYGIASDSKFDLVEVWVIGGGGAETLEKIRDLAGDDVLITEYIPKNNPLIPVESICIKVEASYPKEVRELFDTF